MEFRNGCVKMMQLDTVNLVFIHILKGKRLMSINKDNVIVIWNYETGVIEYVLRYHEEMIVDVFVFDNNSKIEIIDISGKKIVFDYEDGTCEIELIKKWINFYLFRKLVYTS